MCNSTISETRLQLRQNIYLLSFGDKFGNKIAGNRRSKAPFLGISRGAFLRNPAADPRGGGGEETGGLCPPAPFLNFVFYKKEVYKQKIGITRVRHLSHSFRDSKISGRACPQTPLESLRLWRLLCLSPPPPRPL